MVGGGVPVGKGGWGRGEGEGEEQGGWDVNAREGDAVCIVQELGSQPV
jgi:hypothetical protein